MNVASRFQPRARPSHSYLERENDCMPDDSGNESESLTRRKFQRTAAESNASDDSAFRIPSLPASATRPSMDQQRPTFTHHRRRSTLRENTRVPSGPREYPSPGKRAASGSISSLAPSLIDSSNNSTRSILPQSTSEPSLGKSSGHPRSAVDNPSVFNDASRSLATPSERIGTDFDFIPTVNFDDLHNSIANYDPNNTTLLSDFPAVGGGRVFADDTGGNMAKESVAWDSRPPLPKLEPREEAGLSRASSFRRRFSAVTGGRQSSGQSAAKDAGAAPGQSGHLSLRARRQSTAPQGPPPSGPAPPPVGAGSRAPRKSVGPGIIGSMMEGRKTSHPLPNSNVDQTARSAMARSDSLTKTSRRTTMQPSASGGAELPRVSTATAATQARASKVKSLQPPPRDTEPGTPSSRAVSKNTQARAQTPSSSGNKRQSTISGRASGLGARTISPTDARRLKRLSMMQAPPLPSKVVLAAGPEEMPSLKLEMPRLAQPSPSLIPRRTSATTPSSSRASPEARQGSNGGGVSLNTKSSYQSLLPSSASTSRLPTPKPRNAHSSSGHYGEEGEAVPPVPAIPKAYESPRENELPFFPGALKSSQHGFMSDDFSASEFEADVSFLTKMPKPALEAPTETQRKTSVDNTKTHQRMNTVDNIERSVNMTAPKQSWQQLDTTGRKNSSLQPLRLPPLNLLPLNQRDSTDSGYTRRVQEAETCDGSTSIQTPEPKRNTKTPSTPMTASKATFFRRHDEQNSLRSSTSHFALRDLVDDPRTRSQYLDEADAEFMTMGLPIPATKQRSTITPFSSGSLPKASGEFARHRGKPSADYNEDHTMSNFESFQAQTAKPPGPRHSRNGTNASLKTTDTQLSLENPGAENAQPDHRKDGSTTGPRRKLSLSWRRSSSKASNHPDHKSSPQQENHAPEKEPGKLQKRSSQMPPPKLPASGTWAGDIPSMPPPNARPSFDSTRRKYTAAPLATSSAIGGNTDTEQVTSPVKTNSTHNEQPQTIGMANRASSWGTVPPGARSSNPKAPSHATKSRHGSAASSFSALAKDRDDLAADDEMRRLSQKRRDVDTAAKETEELKRRAVARSPMSPDRVLHDRNCTLNIFERGEIMDYEKDGVFFTGANNARKIIGSLAPSPQPSEKDSKGGNYGYDDERGDYNIVLGDHLAYRYEVVDILGKGSFGQVVRCVDHKEGGIVAVKIIRNKKRFHQQALVEVGILGRLRDWDPDGAHATLSITSSFYFRSHLCIVTPCLSINLYELIRAHNFVGFSLPLIRRFARQLLSCLVLLQNKRIIHCDLKPENILLREARKADVRVIDFGSSCKEEEKVYTYIQSRFYRSPEVILGSSYGLGIDMWSFGCILAELWTGYPLFPGENEQEQLACIMEIFGPPDRHLVERCTRKKLFFDSVGKPRVTVSSKGRRRRPSSKTLSQALKSEDEAFLDFITRCLRWDPERRLKPHDAVSHAFIINQPLNHRPGIPDEARRAARLRSTAAVPATGGNIPSPIKRVHTTSGPVGSSSNASAQQQLQQTPAKERSRPLPETPQTALRTGTSTNGNTHTNQGSPSKQTVPQRRQSAMASATSAAVAGSKRASNGVPVGGMAAGTPAQRQGSNNSVSLAQMAAREANAARWRA